MKKNIGIGNVKFPQEVTGYAYTPLLQQRTVYFDRDSNYWVTFDGIKYNVEFSGFEEGLPFYTATSKVS